MEEFLTCQQVAQLLGVSVSTVKRMCDEEILPNIRTLGGHRRILAEEANKYLDQCISKHPVSSVSDLNIQILSPQSIADSLINGQLKDIYDLLVANVRRDHTAVSILDSILAPAMRHIGMLWETKQIDVYEEHMASDRMRSLLQTIREEIQFKCSVESRRNQALGNESSIKTAVGCCVGNELHDLPSLMVEIALIEAGWYAQSLGGNVPAPSLVRAARSMNANVIWISYTYVADLERLRNENHYIRNGLDASQRLVVGGSAITKSLKKLIQADHIGASLAELIDYLNSIDVPKEETNDHSKDRNA